MKKGFTLAELLAVIVILAIILAIAIPSITNVTSNAAKNALESDAKMVAKAINYKMMEDSSFNPNQINESNIKSLLNIDNSNYQGLTVKKVDNNIYVTIIGKNKWVNLTVSGTKTGVKVSDISSSYVASEGVNKPELVTGMTAIKWNTTTSTWDTVNNPDTDTSWYDYVNKQWANAKTADGSMWVWIPRYIYKISTGWHSNTSGTIDTQFSKGVDDNWNHVSIGYINTDETANASNNTWTNHPGFTFGDTELTGIWVAKFEASNDGSTNIKSIPNVVSWRAVNINTIFDETMSMETNNLYGWGTSGAGIDTHLMKNVEWGAVAYLSKSVYGQNTNEIWINASNNMTTGCAGDSATSAATTGCLRTYDTTNGVKASTTGTIYGVYDMSGGSWEYTASYVNNGHSNLTNQANNLVNTHYKYKDVYTVGTTDNETNNYNNTANKKGDAVYETSSAGLLANSSSWFNDNSYMPRADRPWFIRSGNNNFSSGAGAYNFYTYSGTGSGDMGFRPVLLVCIGL